VRIFIFLLVTPTRAVSGKFRPMSAGFPTGICMCRSSEEAHSLLGWRVCAYRETQRFRKTLIYLWSIFWVSSFVNSNTLYLICNNYFITWISWYCMLMCVFVHSQFIENPPVWSWEINPCFLGGFCHNGPMDRSASMLWIMSEVLFLMSSDSIQLC
jgi:hypothetical protein